MTALVDHFPTGCWHQPDGSYAGQCSCGASFAGPSYAEAKQAWADHAAAPAVAIGAGEVEPWGGLPIDTAPAACHVLAGRLDHSSGEWIMAVVASPPIAPFTHWWPLPGMNAPASASIPADVERLRGALERIAKCDIRATIHPDHGPVVCWDFNVNKAAAAALAARPSTTEKAL